MSGMHAPTAQSQLQMFAQPTVMVISGWGGSGKTQTIGRALQGLGRNINEVGVIINERSRGSVDIDIARLPKGFEKLGLHGCACCSQLSDVLAGIKGFASQGRTLTFIEQSPLSVTGDLRNGLRQRGHDNIVVFLFNPAQFNDAPAIQVQGIRDADLVLITHQSAQGAIVERAHKIIKTARGDLAQVPVFVDNAPDKPLPHALWQACMEMRQAKKGGLMSAVTGFFGSKTTPASDFHAERNALVANYSEITLRPYHTSPHDILRAVTSLAAKGVVLSRVKGALPNGVGIDVVQEGDSHALKSGALGEGMEYLSLRSFRTQLSRHAGELAAHIGTPDCSSAFVQQVVAGYPDAAGLAASIKAGAIPFGFESDRFLTDLRVILPHIRFITDAPRRQELGNALVSVMKASIETRLMAIKAFQEPGGDVAAKQLGLLNAHYSLLSLLCDANLKMFYQHPSLAALHAQLLSLNSADKLLSVVHSVPKIRFEGRKDLTREEVRVFGETIRRAKEQGFVTQGAIDAAFGALERSADPDLQAHRAALR